MFVFLWIKNWVPIGNRVEAGKYVFSSEKQMGTHGIQLCLYIKVKSAFPVYFCINILNGNVLQSITNVNNEKGIK